MQFTDADLEAYLDEALNPEHAAELERALRDDPKIMERLSCSNRRRDAGIHTLGEIWRRNQVGVPSTEEVDDFLKGKLSDAHADYIQFRLETLKCRYTIAVVEDLESQQSDDKKAQAKKRTENISKSSANLLSDKKEDK